MRPNFEEVTGIENGRDITRGFVGNIGMYIPATDPILSLKSGGDLSLYEQVAQDDRVKSCLQQRFSALISRKFEVLPGGEKRIDKQAAEWLSAQIESLNWDDITEKQLWGVFYGYSVAECIFAKDGDKVVLKDILVRNRRRFRFGIDKQPKLLSLQSPMGEDLPERKFWSFCVGADNHDEPYGRGLAHWLYWLTWFKRNDWRWWIAFLENFAEPTRIAKYPVGATSEEKRTLQNAVEVLGNKKWAMIPDGMLMELLEASRNGTADYAALNDTINSAIATVILSQTMTTEDGSSLSQAKVHQDVADAVVAEDANLISESFTNGVARWLTEWNFPSAAVPKCGWKLESEPDIKAIAEKDKVLVEMGISPTPKYIQETYGEGFKAPAVEDGTLLSANQLSTFVTMVSQSKQQGWGKDVTRMALEIAFPNVSAERLGGLAAALDSTALTESAEPVSEEDAVRSLDAAAGMFARGRKNCVKGLSCGNTCIAAGRQCHKKNSPTQKARKSRLKKAQVELNPGFVGDIPISEISADPKRFQYKIIGAHTKTGEVGSLSGVQRYDPNLAGIVQVWRDPADQNLYIINGHNRLALAQRAGASDITARIIDAPDAATARGIGALTNIAEGRGTALDAAKFFRDSGLSLEDLKSKGIPLREKIANDGLGIAALEPSLFDKVVNGELSESRAALIGKAELTSSQQIDLHKLGESKSKRGRLSDEAFAELIDSVKASEVQQSTLFDLFGASQVEQSNALERASLTANIKKQLSRDRKLFGLVSKTKAAKDLTRGGNLINQEESGKISEEAASLLGVFDQLKNQSGDISNLLNSYSSKIASGSISPAKAQSEAYKEIVNLIKSGKF